MSSKQNKIDRRDFFKTVGATGLGSVIASTQVKADENASEKTNQAEITQVPKRKLGKTGLEVSVLALGTMFNVIENQILLRKTLQWGANYWDTADCYSGGNSELGIGKFLKANPEKRKDIVIATKSDSRRPKGIQRLLERSLERMNTDYIDIYYLHGVDDPNELDNEVRDWAAQAKAEKKIKTFGFSTHENMEENLIAASKLGWIDVIMTSYNFRLMQNPKMQKAVEACYKAGVGLVAMKTQGHDIESEKDKEMAKHFLQRGFTEGQAKVKIVLGDKRISAACVGRSNLTHLTLNIAAVMDKTQLTSQDKEVFKQYAQKTCTGYCAGCANICHPTVPDAPYISKIMRYLMYYNSYGEHQEAKELFAKIPVDVRSKLLKLDYNAAEARCPQHLPIAKFVAEAASKLA